MTKSNLKEFMLVENRKGCKYIFVGNLFRREAGFSEFENYDENLKSKIDSSLDIMKIYDISKTLTYDINDRQLLWEREEDEELKEKEILQKAIDIYGTVSQMDMAIEEMSELTQAISKYKRAEKSPECWDYEKIKTNICEEIADVEIMLEQLKIIFAYDKEVADWKQKKIARLNERLNSE